MSDSTPTFRSDYPHFLSIPTRWKDNDIYGHVNNVVYYSYFDTVINEYLIRVGGLDIHDSPIIGVCAESFCRFKASFVFPDTVEAGMRVGELRNRSVRYEIGLFREGLDEAAAVGHFVHVFVDRETMTPTPIPGQMRNALERLVVSA